MTYKVLHSFAGGKADGALPYAALIHVNSELYGTTSYGGSGSKCSGSAGCGTAFEISTSGTGERILYSFKAGADGAGPTAALLDVNGLLYGTTSDGGNGANCTGLGGCGTVFTITTTGAENVIHTFGKATDGQLPFAPLIDVNGTLYGTTTAGGGTACGGGSGCGTVYGVNTSGTESLLYRFNGTNGAVPFGSLLDINGELYGTTAGGGVNIAGNIFKISTAGIENSIYSFRSKLNDGFLPYSSLTVVNGVLYGTTAEGGTGNCVESNDRVGCGTVFKSSTSGVESVLYSFKGGKDGAFPLAGLIYVNGDLYGTTSLGGTGPCKANGITGCGTVFKISTSGTESVVHTFAGGTDGAIPRAGLLYLQSNILYGTTEFGGTGSCKMSNEPNGCGTIFSIAL